MRSNDSGEKFYELVMPNGLLTKRELFAAMAMQGMLGAVYSSKEMLNEFLTAKHVPGPMNTFREHMSGCEAITANALSYADALLAGLAKERP